MRLIRCCIFPVLYLLGVVFFPSPSLGPACSPPSQGRCGLACWWTQILASGPCYMPLHQHCQTVRGGWGVGHTPTGTRCFGRALAVRTAQCLAVARILSERDSWIAAAITGSPHHTGACDAFSESVATTGDAGDRYPATFDPPGTTPSGAPLRTILLFVCCQQAKLLIT